MKMNEKNRTEILRIIGKLEGISAVESVGIKVRRILRISAMNLNAILQEESDSELAQCADRKELEERNK